jgi:phosphatidylserine/phosphatidylglycerophosphate/cardiolipin synthase-like enzyme
MDIGQPAHMHHKFALFDGKRLMSGSFNWTRSASEQNEENLIVTPDQTLVAAFSARFEMLWRRM